MQKIKLKRMSVDELVDRFVNCALAQDAAELRDENAKFVRLYWQIEAVKEELKARPGDQRRVLMRLYQHPNAQVRLKAANATLAIAPERARQVLQAIKDWKEFPQALDAGMTLIALDDGTFVPK